MASPKACRPTSGRLYSSPLPGPLLRWSPAAQPALLRPSECPHQHHQHLSQRPHHCPSAPSARRTRVTTAAATVPAAATATATATAAASSSTSSAAATSTTAAATASAAASTVSASSPWVDLSAVVLGYACLAGSLFRSVPQIAIILRTGSAEGLSLTSNLVELICFTIVVAYNIQQGYAFNTYGEVFACWVQDAIIVGLIMRHMRLAGRTVAASCAAFAVGTAWLFSAWCSMEVLSWLQLSTIAVMAVGARLPQIWLNVKRGDAGVLSPFTCLLNVAGCLVRIYTTMVLTGDTIILGGYITQLILNAILLYQSVANPGIRAPATSATPAAAAAAAVAATDPPAGGSGEARGQPPALQQAAGSSGKEEEGGSGAGGFGTGSPLPAAA